MRIVAQILGIAGFALALMSCSGRDAVASAAADSGTPAPDAGGIAATPVATPISLPERQTTCHDIIGQLIDPAPEGRNVRAGPSVTAERIGLLPPPLSAEQVPNWGSEVRVEFEIIGSANGWLHIRAARYDQDKAGTSVPDVFAGEGWISGRDVLVTVQTQLGFAAPSHSSAILIDGRPDVFFEGWRQRRIAGCDGQWVLIDWAAPPDVYPDPQQARWRDEAISSHRPLTLRAWSAGVCNNMETSCDGVNGDTAERAFTSL